MLIAMVSMRVKPGSEEAFLAAIEQQARTSLATEAGCLRFDVLRLRDDPLAFTLYEVYTDEQSFFETHRSTAHFAAWARAAADLVDGERVAVLAEPILMTPSTA